MKKALIVVLVLVVLTGLGYGLGKPMMHGWMMSVPDTAFNDTPLPAAPDYQQERWWAALPWREDSADWVPVESDYADKQVAAAVDVFFIHPTAAFYGDYWVAGLENRLHRLSVDYGIQPQHVTAFNGVGKIYAPRYRSVRMPIWWADDRDSVEQATVLAYSDVKKAFAHYLEHWNQGRPFIVVSHSQGTLHAIRLFREMLDGQPLQDKLVAAYLVGNTIPDRPWFQHIPLCASPEQTGCYVTWNTMLEGGNPHHWLGEKGLDETECVNPLSWKADTAYVPRTENGGSLPMVGAGVLFHRIGPLLPGVVGARCGKEGMLWIREKPAVKGFSSALFEGGSYHTYDLNFYYSSIRRNAGQRTDAYLSRARSAEQP